MSPNHSHLLMYDDDDEVVCYDQPTAANEAFPIFEEIRRSGKLCDVTLVAGQHRFSAHRVLLAATIPYFRFVTEILFSKQFNLIC